MIQPDIKLKKILLIDDNPIDNMISQQFIDASEVPNECITIDSSLDAFDYLEETNPSEFPDVIFLDLNMPIYNGFEFLDKIEKMVNAKIINSKVYVLTSSRNPKDMQRANTYSAVAGYLVKPLNANVVSQICMGAFKSY